MVRAAAGHESFEWPCGAYLSGEPYSHVIMAMPTTLGPDGVSWTLPQGEPDELAELEAAYGHLQALRDQTIELGILPPLEAWGRHNPHLG
jgi:malate dehydrogenase